MKNCRGWSDHFIELQSNLFLQTSLYQFVWSQKCQKSYIPYLYNTDTSVKRTLGSIPLVSVLKRFDCTFQMASDLIHVIGKDFDSKFPSETKTHSVKLHANSRRPKDEF